MIDFLKKIYSIFLRQNGWWLEQFQESPSRPMLAGFILLIGYMIFIRIFNLSVSATFSSIVLGISLILISISGALWMREDRFPLYITGLFVRSHKFQKLQAILWVLF
jgi:membrane-bound ClpP family serine protease